MKSKIIVGLDVGSYAVKGIAAQISGQSPQIIAKGFSPSSGVRRGVIVDIEEVVKSIREVINFLSQSANKKISEVYAVINGTHLVVRPSKGVVAVALADGEITGEDVLRVIGAAKTISLPPNREILQVLPQEYVIDGEGGVKEPLGMFGVRLEVNALIIDGASSFVKNFRKVLEIAGLRSPQLIISPLAIARAVLSKRQKELGTAVIDIGAGTTVLTVFEEGELCHFQVFPFGSSIITNELARKFKTSVDIAEKIKQEYGTCQLKSVSKKEIIDLASLGEEGRGKCMRRDAVAAIEGKVEEIFQSVQKELKKIGKAGLLPGGIVLCGGGSNLPGMDDIARKVFRLPVQIGQAEEVKISDPEYMGAIGAMMWGFDLQNVKIDFGSGSWPWWKKLFRFFLP